MGSDGKTINRETVDGKTSDRKTSIRRKINVLITVIILVVSVSLFVAAYRSFCSEVDQVNGENLVRAAKSASSIIFLWFDFMIEYLLLLLIGITITKHLAPIWFFSVEV